MVTLTPDCYASNEDWAAAGIPLPRPGSSYRIEHVEVVGPLTLRVRHRDGVEGIVRLEESYLRGVFAPLRDEALFRQVYNDHGAVAWPGEIDLAPDNMHRHLFAFGEWVLR